MTNEEVKKALQERFPVKYNGIEYSCVTAIIYRYDARGKLLVSAELLDKNKNCVVIALIKDVHAINESL